LDCRSDFCHFQNGFQKTTEPAQPKTPNFTCLSALIDFIFIVYANTEYFFILLALSHLYLIFCGRYNRFYIFCIKSVAMRNKLVLKIVSKLAFC